jgi:iron(III) transport system substrate-binding protein
MKSLRRFVALCLSVLLVAGALAGCGSGQSADSSQNTGENAQADQSAENQEDAVLVVYTARSEQLNNAVIPEFEKATGIKVDVVVAGTGEVLKRVESEKANPQGDILWAADETMLSQYKDLFMQYVSPEDGSMQPAFRNKSGYFTPAFADPTVMVVNTNLKGNLKLDSFSDLINPELKGRIAFGDPINSSSAFQCLMAMLYASGKGGDPLSDEAWAFIDQFIANLDGKIANSSSLVYKGVAEGEYVVGLTWEDPAANLVKSGAPVEVVFPTEGAVFPGESVQIIAGCQHPGNAKQFVDFMLSEQVQSWVGQNLTVRPLREGTALADYMTPMSGITLFPSYDEAWVAENKAKITDLYSQHLEDSM